MLKKLLLLVAIWSAITIAVVGVTHILFPGWELLSLIFVALLVVIKVLDQVSGALGLIDRIFAEFEYIGFDKAYRQFQLNLYRSFDTKGLYTQGSFSLELERIFVELLIDFEKLHTVSDALVPILDKQRFQPYSIWDILRIKEIKKQNLVVLGPPGSGKTTLLRHIALMLASDKKRRQALGVSDKLSITLALRNHSNKIVSSRKEGTIYTFVDAVTYDLALHSLSLPNKWLRKHLAKGRFLILLDGLDEIADAEERRSVTDWIEIQIHAHRSNRFLITSRPHGYTDNTISEATLVEVQPFNFLQIERFVLNWYSANEILSRAKESEELAQQNAKDLLNRLRISPILLELAVNPLLLTMITTIHYHRSTLPEGRAQLYAEIFDVLLENRQKAKGVQIELAPTQALSLLQHLAYYMMSHQKTEIDLTDTETDIRSLLETLPPETHLSYALRTIEYSSGLLTEREPERFGFVHKTFQEYLTAIHAVEGKVKINLLTKVTDEWWYETLYFYASLTGATPVIRACLTEKQSITALALAVDCLEGGSEVSAEIQAQLEDFLERGLESDNPNQRRVAAEVKLNRRLRQFVRVSKIKEIDYQFVSNAEYQVFLDEMIARHSYYQPDHLSSTQFSPGTAQEPIVGIRSSDAEVFCRWLTARQSKRATFRLPYPNEIDFTLGSRSNSLGWWVFENGITSIDINGLVLKIIADQFREYLLEGATRDIDYHFSSLITEALVGQRYDREINIDQFLNEAVERVFSKCPGLDLDETHKCASSLYTRKSYPIDHFFVTELVLTLSRTLGFNYHIRGIIDRVISTVLGQNYALAAALEFALERNQEQALIDALNRIRGIAIIGYFDRFLGDKRTHARDLAQNLKSQPLRGLAIEFIRFYSLTAAVAIQQSIICSNDAQIQSKPAQTTPTSSAAAALRDEYLDLYVNIVLLDGRRKGHLAAFEGIHLIREDNLADGSPSRQVIRVS